MAKGKFYGIEIFDLDAYLKNRDECVSNKSNALVLQSNELNGILNLTKFSKRFFNKTHSWFFQRLNGSVVMNKEQSFKEEEYAKIAEGYREIAKQLIQYADELDKAEMD